MRAKLPPAPSSNRRKGMSRRPCMALIGRPLLEDQPRELFLEWGPSSLSQAALSGHDGE